MTTHFLGCTVSVCLMGNWISTFAYPVLTPKLLFYVSLTLSEFEGLLPATLLHLCIVSGCFYTLMAECDQMACGAYETSCLALYSTLADPLPGSAVLHPGCTLNYLRNFRNKTNAQAPSQNS